MNEQGRSRLVLKEFFWGRGQGEINQRAHMHNLWTQTITWGRPGVRLGLGVGGWGA